MAIHIATQHSREKPSCGQRVLSLNNCEKPSHNNCARRTKSQQLRAADNVCCCATTSSNRCSLPKSFQSGRTLIFAREPFATIARTTSLESRQLRETACGADNVSCCAMTPPHLFSIWAQGSRHNRTLLQDHLYMVNSYMVHNTR